MNSFLLLRGGQLAGLVGTALTVLAVVVRLAVGYTFAGFQAGRMMLDGIGAISVGCFLLL